MVSAWLSWILPLVGAAATPLFAKLGRRVMGFAAVAFAGGAAVCAARLLPLLAEPGRLPIVSAVPWLTTPIQVNFGVLLDPLSVVVANVVAGISFFILIYCLGYMRDDPEVARFWTLMNLFIGSMLLLVLASNLLFTFVGWKLVGLCSYGLIGYYYRDEKKYWIGGPAPFSFISPSACGLKALLVTGAGDMLMLGGVLILYRYAGTLDLLQLYLTAPDWIARMAAAPGMIGLVSVLLLAGPVGKSAQFPLHEWLPEAMAGPGPVSALIHAATMVKSGVFLVARIVPMFALALWMVEIREAQLFFTLTAWVGAVTAFLAASQGLVALELKKALAYSTVSQIGYMMLALGLSGFSPEMLAAGYTAGVFHLITHAFFKACLFLCAGTVIHAVHSIYLHEMGGLRRSLPYTWAFMAMGGLSLMGVPPFPGFWSKDAVLKVCLESGQYALFAIAAAAAVFTAFYTMRMLGLVFHGAPAEGSPGGSVHAAEGRPSQTLACAVLAFGILALGVLGPRLEHGLTALFSSQLPVLPRPLFAEDPLPSFSPLLVPALAVACLLIGAVPAWLFYVQRSWKPEAILSRSNTLKLIHIFLWERWYIDRFYGWFFVGGIRALASWIAGRFETALDDAAHRRLPDLVGRGARRLIERMRSDALDLTDNLAYVLAATIVFLAAMLWWTR
ncbi:MAG: NADH-quinone oxidoreductase subunit L [Desulfobacterales bacterium]